MRPLLVPLCLVVALTGCPVPDDPDEATPSATPTEEPTATATPTPDPTPEPSPEPSPTPVPTEDCNDGLDNDLDGSVDCDDSDCAAEAHCIPETDCGDGVDNDLDGSIDCDDSDCAASCGEDCSDGVDNDLDGNVDCEDGDCAAEAVCLPESVCDDGNDDDLDGLIDCADDDCWGAGCAATVVRVVSGNVNINRETWQSSYTCYGADYQRWGDTFEMNMNSVAGVVQVFPSSGAPTTCDWFFPWGYARGGSTSSGGAGTVRGMDHLLRGSFNVDSGCGFSSADSGFMPQILWPNAGEVGEMNAVADVVGWDASFPTGVLWYHGVGSSNYNGGTNTATTTNCTFNTPYYSHNAYLTSIDPSEPYTALP